MKINLNEVITNSKKIKMTEKDLSVSIQTFFQKIIKKVQRDDKSLTAREIEAIIIETVDESDVDLTVREVLEKCLRFSPKIDNVAEFLILSKISDKISIDHDEYEPANTKEYELLQKTIVESDVPNLDRTAKFFIINKLENNKKDK